MLDEAYGREIEARQHTRNQVGPAQTWGYCVCQRILGALLASAVLSQRYIERDIPNDQSYSTYAQLRARLEH